MKVSIFTDASIVENNCGYAFYIGCKSAKIQKAGKLRKSNINITLAELHCIANAVYTLKHSKIDPVTKIFIYTDNSQCVDALNKDARFKDAETRSVVDEIHFLMMEICVKHGMSIRYIYKMFSINHIKAHTGKTDIMSKINHWCDVNARKYAKPNKQLNNK